MHHQNYGSVRPVRHGNSSRTTPSLHAAQSDLIDQEDDTDRITRKPSRHTRDQTKWYDSSSRGHGSKRGGRSHPPYSADTKYQGERVIRGRLRRYMSANHGDRQNQQYDSNDRYNPRIGNSNRGRARGFGYYNTTSRGRGTGYQQSSIPHRRFNSDTPARERPAMAHSRLQQSRDQFSTTRLSFAALETISKYPTEIRVVEEVFSCLKGFQQSLNTCNSLKSDNQKNQYVDIVLTIIFKVSKLLENESSMKILGEFLSERCEQFHMLLAEYVRKLTDDSFYISSKVKIEKLCSIFEILLNHLPTSSWTVLPIDDLYEASKSASLSSDLMDSVTHLKKQHNEIKESFKQQRLKASKQNSKNAEADFSNWDDSLFRSIEILPSVNEVRIDSPPQLRPNLIEQSYKGWDHYYDVQFRLLREDFVAPLRRGIQNFLRKAEGKNHDINLYKDVQVIEPVFTRQGMCFEICFDNSGFRRSWEHSKRLMYGSLLCLSSDNFEEEIIFGTVLEREVKHLDDGFFVARFDNHQCMFEHQSKKTRFLMAESRAYFEATRHILSSLQTAEVETMPFCDYLLNFKGFSSIKPPAYLTNNHSRSRYDMRWIYSGRKNSEYVSILKESDWPQACDVELDQSQLDAIKMALTQEIAIIQGPPGTGKTYIGYKIVQTLLENRDVWDPHSTSPILVMCYTNHALDQFLEGIIDHEISWYRGGYARKQKPDIVRIGGRSQSEKIQNHSLRNIRHNFVPGHKYHAVKQMKLECESIASNIAFSSEQLKKIVYKPVSRDMIGVTYHPLFWTNSLRPFILPSHLYQITQLADNVGEIPFTLEMWLGLWEKVACGNKETTDLATEGDSPTIGDLTIDHTESDSSSQVVENIPKNEIIRVKGEAEIEEDSRRLEGDDYSPIGPKKMETNGNDALYVYLNEKNKNSEENDVDQEDNEFVWRRKTPYWLIYQVIDRINSIYPMDEELEAQIEDITDPSFSDEERYQLLRLWVKKYEEHLIESSRQDIVEYDRKCKEYKEADQDLDRIALEKAEVIGMTTTGAAKYQHIIHLVKPKIVIVEEAAELLESHIVSALNAGTQHLILIGDHKQLRPKPNEYDLAMKHNLHISLFERLILNGLPHATLMIQHRMRPQIASLVCPHIYDKLINHESVMKYNNVRGFRKNMYFFHHEQEEQHNQQALSHANKYEAEFIVGLCWHILKLGYEPSQVTILTAYSGQLLKLMNMMPKAIFEGVKITNVDNFQGEENDIIILSLVRNNDYGSVGFLSEKNRVCVALSRARMGLYCFGNFQKLLRVKVPIWDEILTQVEEEGCLGSAFPLQCPNHDDFVFDVSEPEDFAKHAPEGGCGKPCVYRLDCGHTCKRKCHGDDADHNKYQCTMACDRQCEEGHNCRDYCYKVPCPPCIEAVTKSLPCGHTKLMRCCDDPDDAMCNERCGERCKNDLHKCPLKCWNKCRIFGCRECSFNVVKVSTCGHYNRMSCYQNPEDFECSQICGKVICEDNHTCPKQCWENCGSCETMVPKKLPRCEHTVQLPCHVDPSEHACKEKCSTKYLICGHKCQKTCSEKCDPVCMKFVRKKSQCGHEQMMPCFQLPENWTCKEQCAELLKCGHRCGGYCGEPCLLYPCKVMTELLLPCDHSFSVECSKATILMRLKVKQGKIECTEKCKKKLKCGHPCQNRCSEPCTVKCQVIEDRKCHKGVHKVKAVCGESLSPCEKKCREKLSCGHSCTNECGEDCIESCSAEIKDFPCPCGHKHNVICNDKTRCKCQKKCNAILKCGHKCFGKCGECFTSRIHAPCVYEVVVKRFCGHHGTVPCFGLEDQCNKTCQAAACLHKPTSSCRHECSQPCDTCDEPCPYECSHKKCTRPCSQPCDVAPCDKPCDKTLECGHQCMGMCGEKCLSRCIICNREAFVSVKGLDKKAKPDSSRYIELNCGHFFTVAYLDKCYRPQVYKDKLVSPLFCPTCQKITTCSRYMGLMKDKEREIKCVKLIRTESGCEMTVLEAHCNEFRKALESILIRESENMTYVRSLRDKSYTINASFIRNLGDNTETKCILDLLAAICKLCSQLSRESSDQTDTVAGLLKKVMSIVVESKTRGLSLQLIDDIKKEMYRITLLFLAEKVNDMFKTFFSANAKGTKDFGTVLNVLDQAESKNGILTPATYQECVRTLTRIHKLYSTDEVLSVPVDIDGIEAPVITKGQWYCCARAGHYYFVPAKYQQGKKAKAIQCEQCP